MKRISIVLFSLFFITTMLLPEELKQREIHEFRSLNWGMSRDELLKAKKGQSCKVEDNLVTLEEVFAGSHYLFFFQFDGDKLVKINGQTIEEYSVIQDYLLDFDKLELYISYFYGEPFLFETAWQDPADREKYTAETAICRGLAEKRMVWHTAKSEMTIRLTKLEGMQVPRVCLSLQPRLQEEGEAAG